METSNGSSTIKNLKMKKILVLILMATISISCNNSNELETQSTPDPIGVEIPNDSTRISLYGG